MSTSYTSLCRNCGTTAASNAIRCSRCAGTLEFCYPGDAWVTPDLSAPGMWRYRQLLPISAAAHPVSLGEGMTPLLASRTRGEAVLFKDETRNPTGSHKDRALSIAITHAIELAVSASIVVSSGSTGVSHAAFAARAGLRSVVIVPESTPAERVYPLRALGSTVLAVAATVDEAISHTEELAADHGLYLSSTCRSSNPYQAEAPKTIAYEIIDDLGRAPDWMVVPVGGGGTIAGLWRGFCDLHKRGVIDSLPRLLAAVPDHYDSLRAAAELANRFADPAAALAAVEDRSEPPPTIQVKTAHVHPPDGAEALAALRASGGHVFAVSDRQALEAQRTFGAAEGLYIEPSSASAVVALELGFSKGLLERDATTVVLLSGSGFRETFAVCDLEPIPHRQVRIEGLARVLDEIAADPVRVV